MNQINHTLKDIHLQRTSQCALNTEEWEMSAAMTELYKTIKDELIMTDLIVIVIY